ncbi:MAG TPA: segregation/condensation protein A [Ignavibacteriales bacterium]|nr:segregation/condensation protein A [Ignavibacteriales bacterium]HOL80617.1 segregation/condensation protein A [Ignavibacteriales bacterium]HOM64305.1 segregation/condensation protein A [Ignavibacteriales bacterium]HPD68035.1 segregation/condensation protein A [Ignavibacteriales bacterium]HPP33049.1 segregation/condensation protein A [Ignavibacteriales bacterium]
MYTVKLQEFEGPLDLLYFFVKRDELNILDIPIHHITNEFIEYIRLMQMLDLEVASEFILMAANLMHIKVKMLLPREKNEKGEEIDPREELIKALIEYKRFKEVSYDLAKFEEKAKKFHFRGNFDEDPKLISSDYHTLLKNVSVFDLAKMFKNIVDKIPPKPVIHQVQKFSVTLEEMQEYIINKLNEVEKISFLNLVIEFYDKIKIIVTFLASLELVKAEKIGLEVSEEHNMFYLYRLDQINEDNNE